jgi:hypothetical protein
MLEQIKNLRKKLEKLGRKELRIRAGGRYPNKYRTEVQKVAKWQNDGTDRGVTPARFVEKAASARNNWQQSNAAAVWDFLTGGGDVALLKLGLQISSDISAACDRIKTGRLKSSFNPEIKTR